MRPPMVAANRRKVRNAVRNPPVTNAKAWQAGSASAFWTTWTFLEFVPSIDIRVW